MLRTSPNLDFLRPFSPSLFLSRNALAFFLSSSFNSLDAFFAGGLIGAGLSLFAELRRRFLEDAAEEEPPPNSRPKKPGLASELEGFVALARLAFHLSSSCKGACEHAPHRIVRAIALSPSHLPYRISSLGRLLRRIRRELLAPVVRLLRAVMCGRGEGGWAFSARRQLISVTWRDDPSESRSGMG